MKFIITETQYKKLSKMEIEHLKKPMFKYWDMTGDKDYKTAMKLFSIPSANSTVVEEWLIEWMGGEDEIIRELDKYIGRIFRGESGSYDFRFYVDSVRIDVNPAEIYLDVVIDINGSCNINHDDKLFTKIIDAAQDEHIGWEVYDELRDVIRENIEMVIDDVFPISIDTINFQDI